MKRRFKRSGPLILVRLDDYETTLLESLVEQLSELIEADESAVAADDPFARWQAELDEVEPLDRADPVIRRLFPDAYPNDPAASAEFHRLTQSKQRADRISQADVVLTALQDSQAGKHPVQIRLIELDQWLKTLTSLRLSLAVRLGIQTAADADALDDLEGDDPRSYIYRVYEWLGYLSEGILSQA